jgi:phytoene dehydrogenase-like protein
MPDHYDAIIIGAGHNGLTCACYLARARLRVLMLEQYHTVGGMTVTEEETLPGFWSDIHASGYQLANLSPVPNELALVDRDISRKIISAVRGMLGQGAFVPYQTDSLRPTPELGQYKTPVPNVYLCSSGIHPGPGVSMAPGRNAAQVIFA